MELVHGHRTRADALKVAATAMLLGPLLLSTTGCPRPPEPPIHGEGTPPRIDVPAPQNRVLLEPRPEVLDELSEQLGLRVRAQFPAYDGDPFFVSLPAREATAVSAEGVLERLVVPVVRAVGIERDARQALALPPPQGVPMERADFSGLAQAVAFEYENNPEALRPGTRKMLDVFLGRLPADDTINRALEMGEGMDFAQFVAGIERLEIQFPFRQVEGEVPIEHTMLMASRWEGQTITSLRGVLFNRYAVVNRPTIDSSEPAVQAAIEALRAVDGVDDVLSKWPEDGPHLVLLPYGTDAAGITQMRYAYRMVLRGVSFGQEGPFMLWLDAENGSILKLEPGFGDAVNARGEVYNRDPGIGTKTSFFQVDESVGGQYSLQLAGVMNRVDYLGDGDATNDVSIANNTNGSSATFANFDQAAINDETQALCAAGTNKDFQQVNFFGSIYGYYQRTLWLGVFRPFPGLGGLSTDSPTPWNPKVESASAGCNAYSNMNFGACDGYYDAACPNFSDGSNSLSSNGLNTAHDNTFVAHELAHNSNDRFTNWRPTDWCGTPGCAIPVGWGTLHDLCDFWAAHFESTNCWSGWFAKNVGGVPNASLNCLAHNEGGSAPRLHEVTVPFNPAAVGDHFPEHRAIASGPYADMHIATAALWQVRLGMRSKCRPSGMPQFAVRFARALKNTGFFTPPSSSDAGIYRYLYDLEVQMLDQWATAGSPGGPPAFRHNGAHTTNKVTAGFARTGLFLIPYQCLDGDAATGDPSSCPVADGGEFGGDAVVDIDDNDIADDFRINDVGHPEFDFLELGGPAPTFHVWTGPKYRLDGAGGASTFSNPAPCNASFRVEVSTDPAFPPGTVIRSPWIEVDTDPTTADPSEGPWDCYGQWSPNPGQWRRLQRGGALSRIYYRARTRDAADSNERWSTQPGNGLWTVPPPYAVLTTDGQSDY